MDQQWIRVGKVIVDSASLWIGDPIYGPMSRLSGRSYTPPISELCPKSTNGFCERNDWPFSGLFFYTAYGDGVYTVYAQFDRDDPTRPVRVMVDLTEDDDEA
ncbi:MAG: hypothetical protein IT304_09005 [Dehalococcoidia bacterium]|nr:hypothetical protein [Dehalococcoidia bacterium]